MKIALRIDPIWGCKLDYNYNYQTYCFISDLNNKLHNKRKVGKFTFTFKFDKRTIYEKSEISLHPNDKNILFISSSDDDFINEINNNIDKNKIYNIGKFKFKILDTQIKEIDYTGYRLFELGLLSPMVVRNGKQCLSPDDPKYIDSLKNNIERKLGKNDIDIVIHSPSNKVKKKRIKIKNGAYVTGHLFDFSVKMNDDTSVNRLIEDGFGSLNTQGFGFVEIKKAIEI